MLFRKLAAAAALAAAGTPAAALDPGELGTSTSALTTFYISIPLDSRPSRKTGEQWSVGLQIQGKRDYQAVRIDSTTLNAFSLNDIDAKWMVGGLVTLGAIAAVSYRDKKTANQLQQQQAQQQSPSGGSPAAPCPRPPSDPCKK
jgi:hypothetical protein